MNIKRNDNNKIPVIISGNDNVNNLGVARALGRHGIPVILLSSNHRDIVRYSRYITKSLKFPDPKTSEDEYVEFLLNLGQQFKEKCVIIPTNDAAVMALSRHKDKLAERFILPIPDFDVIETCVNKRRFYQRLMQMSVPHPRTYFASNLTELKSIGEKVEYPYIIKPSHMHLFTAAFDVKCFKIESSQGLEQAIEKLKETDLDVFIQEIIPGKEFYSLSMYLNKQSEPLSVCGYDKLRQAPSDFGVGTSWRSAWRDGPIDSATQILRDIHYYGLAEIEFIKDPIDNQYKCLEINARTVIPNSLQVKCGTNISYIAYLDSIGQYSGDSTTPRNGILWLDEINDLRVCIQQVYTRKSKILDIIKSLRGKKVFAIAAWNDPLPMIVSVFHAGSYYIRKFSKLLNIKKLFNLK